MELDRDGRLLRFTSEAELDALHRELTLLLREVTVSVTASASDANEARARAEALLAELATVAELLNTLRAHR